MSEVDDLAALLYRLPAPARKTFAAELVDLGVRVHPELATKQLVREGPEWMGNHAPQRLASLSDPAELLAELAAVDPGLAARVQAVKDDAVAREAERERLGALLPPDLKKAVDAAMAAKGR